MKRKRRRDPNSLPALKKKLDTVFSRYIRLAARDKDMDGLVPCYTCNHWGEVKTMQAGHWIPRQHMVCRWEEWNVHPQCYACNMFYGGRPQEYRERLVEEFGEMEVARLALTRHEARKWERHELQELIEKYREKVKEMEDEDDSSK